MAQCKQDMTAIVTGASSGIGREFARQLAGKGINVVLISNQAKELEETREQLEQGYPNQKFYSYYKDLTDEHCATDILTYCKERELYINIVINDAGIFAFKEVCEMSASHIDLFIDLHVRAVTHISQVLAQDMLRRGSDGYILNMSSMSCWMPMPGIGMYAATKAYIRVLSRAMQLELKGSNVSVTVACPGGIATDLFGLSKKLQRIAVKLGVLVTPEKFVKKALKSMFKRKRQYINGLLNRISIFIVAILPTSVKMLVKHKLLDKQKN